MVARSPVLGSQTPTHRWAPERDYDLAEDCFDMATLIGVELDEYQRDFIIDVTGRVERNGKDVWASFEDFIELARQNGKSVVLDVIALTALYVWRLRKIVYSAHDGLTVQETMERLQNYIRSTPQLRAETPDRWMTTGNGKEKIRCSTGRLLFKTRTSGGGRGLDADLVIADEAQELVPLHIAALFPVLRARPDPKIIYAGSAGGQKSVILGRLVKRLQNAIDALLAGKEPAEPYLCGWRFAGDENDDPADPKAWAKTNPALGRRVTLQWMQNEQRSMPADKFWREIMTVGDYPREDGEDWVIPASRYEATTLDGTQDTNPLDVKRFGRGYLAIDAHPQQEWAAIGLGGPAGVFHPDRPDEVKLKPNGTFIEVLDHQRGVRWLGPRLLDLMATSTDLHDEVIVDPKGPLGRLIPELEQLGIKIRQLKTDDVVAACGWIYDGMVNEPATVWHRGAPVLTSALASAAPRPLQGGFAWRRQGQADISPFYAVTFAGYAAATSARRPSKSTAIPRRASASPSRRQPPSRTAPRRRRTSDDLSTANF